MSLLPYSAAKKSTAPKRRAALSETATDYLASILESSNDGIIELTMEGLVTDWNPAATRIFGYAPHEIVNRSVQLLIPLELLDEAQAMLTRARGGERVPHYETVRLRKGGARIDVSLTISPVRNRSGEIVGTTTIIHDITELKRGQRMDAELQRVHAELRAHAQKLEHTVAERTAHLQRTIAELEGVSYSLSHDLRGPLRTIQGFVQLVLEDAGDRLQPEEKQLLEKAIKAAHRLDRLIQDVLTYTRVSRQSVTLENVDVERLLHQIVDERPELRSPHAEIEIQSPLLPVHGHEASLTQIITNLLDNAVKFVPPERKPRIRIHSRPAGDQVELCFEDNGIGIPQEAQSRLFAIFQRVHDDKRYPGTGIGLAIVRKAVERMGGSVHLESELGQGSRFYVRLPNTLHE